MRTEAQRIKEKCGLREKRVHTKAVETEDLLAPERETGGLSDGLEPPLWPS